MENRQRPEPKSPQEIVVSGLCCALSNNLRALLLEQFQHAIQDDLENKKDSASDESAQEQTTPEFFDLGISAYFRKRRLKRKQEKAQAVQDFDHFLTVTELVKIGDKINQSSLISTVKAMSKFDENYKKLLKDQSPWRLDYWLPWRTSTPHCPLFLFLNAVKNLPQATTHKELQENLKSLKETSKCFDFHPELASRFAAVQIALSNYAFVSRGHIQGAQSYATEQLASASSEVGCARRAMRVSENVPIDIAVAAAFPATLAKDGNAIIVTDADKQFDCSDLVEKNTNVPTIAYSAIVQKVKEIIQLPCFNPARFGGNQNTPAPQKKRSLFGWLFGSSSDYQEVPQSPGEVVHDSKTHAILEMLGNPNLTLPKLGRTLEGFIGDRWEGATAEGREALLELKEFGQVFKSAQLFITGPAIEKAVSIVSRSASLAEDNDYAKARKLARAKLFIIDAYGLAGKANLDTTYQYLFDCAKRAPLIAPQMSVFDGKLQSALRVKQMLIATVKQAYGKCPLSLSGNDWLCDDKALLAFANEVSAAARSLDHPEWDGLYPSDQYNLLLIAVALDSANDSEKAAIKELFRDHNNTFPYENLQQSSKITAIVKIKPYLIDIRAFVFGRQNNLATKWGQLVTPPSRGSRSGSRLLSGGFRLSASNSSTGEPVSASDQIKKELHADTKKASNEIISSFTGSSGRAVAGKLDVIFEQALNVSLDTKPVIFMLAMLQWYKDQVSSRNETGDAATALGNTIDLLVSACDVLYQVLVNDEFELQQVAESLTALSSATYKNKENNSFYKLLGRAKSYAPNLFEPSAETSGSDGASNLEARGSW